MDGFFSTVYCPVNDIITGIACICGDDTSFYRVVDSSVGCCDRFLLGNISHNLRLESDHSAEEGTNMVFRLCDIYVLSRFKMMAHLIGMKWDFVTVRCCRRISCNCAKQHVC